MWLPVKDIIAPSPSRSFFILVGESAEKQPRFDKNRILGRLNVDLFIIFSARSSQKSSWSECQTACGEREESHVCQANEKEEEQFYLVTWVAFVPKWSKALGS